MLASQPTQWRRNGSLRLRPSETEGHNHRFCKFISVPALTAQRRLALLLRCCLEFRIRDSHSRQRSMRLIRLLALVATVACRSLPPRQHSPPAEGHSSCRCSSNCGSNLTGCTCRPSFRHKDPTDPAGCPAPPLLWSAVKVLRSHRLAIGGALLQIEPPSQSRASPEV